MTATDRWRQIVRVCLAPPVIICCYLLIVDCSRVGSARFLSMLSIIQSSVEPADRAVKIAPDDPEAHYTRGLELVNLQRLDEALVELRLATQLRPCHYYEWMDLGVTLDRSGDRAGAEAALRNALSLAPAFAQPHWQLGNFLFRAERYPEAFEELRAAVKSDPDLTVGLLGLAWLASNGESHEFLQLVRPSDTRGHLETARFFATERRGDEAAEQVREGGQIRNENERSLLVQTISQLLSAKQFSSALTVWKTSHPSSLKNNGSEEVINGDFAEPILRYDPGFGWQLTNTPSVTLAMDPSGPAPGTRSLRIEYSGESAPSARIVNQLILVLPNSHYSLKFMSKSDALVSGGPPVISVVDMNADPPQKVGQAEPLPGGTRDWGTYSFDFSTGRETRAVVVGLERQACSQGPCPIFGKLWLSSFAIARR